MLVIYGKIRETSVGFGMHYIYRRNTELKKLKLVPIIMRNLTLSQYKRISEKNELAYKTYATYSTSIKSKLALRYFHIDRGVIQKFLSVTFKTEYFYNII